jgi:hypothetical protein
MQAGHSSNLGLGTCHPERFIVVTQLLQEGVETTSKCFPGLLFISHSTTRRYIVYIPKTS